MIRLGFIEFGMYIDDMGRRTIVEHWVRYLVDDFCGRGDFEAGPLLHGSSVDGFLLMLSKGMD